MPLNNKIITECVLGIKKGLLGYKVNYLTHSRMGYVQVVDKCEGLDICIRRYPM